MLLAVEGIAGSGKSTLRDRLLDTATQEGIFLGHIGQFSWLSLESTRIVIALRAGRTPVSEETALTAVYHDLILHARYNLTPARACGHVVADRLTLSTACLLALLYHSQVERYLELLITVDVARPELTVLLNTPAELCMDRVRMRTTERRFGEDPHTAARLAEMYEQAADAWEKLTGQLVLRRRAMTPRDTDRSVDEAIAYLRHTAVSTIGTDLGA
ncbi:MAG: hypothetical protein ACRDSR_08015 [Pseudonocardiaceae bacterium]